MKNITISMKHVCRKTDFHTNKSYSGHKNLIDNNEKMKFLIFMIQYSNNCF